MELTRRKFVSTVLGGSAALGASLVSCQKTNQGGAVSGGRPPNIVFIMADDLGWRELGCYGQQKIRTPNIDRLAREGMRFTDYYSGSPVCAPSRCVLMTGFHSGHAVVRNNFEVKPSVFGDDFGGQYPLPDESVRLAELLKGLGYATGAFGKWGLGGVGTSGDPLKQGFDRFFGYNCQRHAHNLYPRYLVDNDRQYFLEGNTRGITGRHYAPQVIADKMLDWVREKRTDHFSFTTLQFCRIYRCKHPKKRWPNTVACGQSSHIRGALISLIRRRARPMLR